jgi:hypothetical protein
MVSVESLSLLVPFGQQVSYPVWSFVPGMKFRTWYEVLNQV